MARSRTQLRPAGDLTDLVVIACLIGVGFCVGFAAALMFEIVR